MASPILPCGCLCSLPIPYKGGGISYSDIRFGRRTLEQVCRELNPKWLERKAHLDPDLRADALVHRPAGWRPAFGQSGAAEGHLHNQCIGEGDLFIFFGWFRQTALVDGCLRFRNDDMPGRHIVYGWLMVEDTFDVDGRDLPARLKFLAEHAHTRFVTEYPNRIYIGTAGVFTQVHDELVLTKKNCKGRSLWSLPSVFKSLYQQSEPDLTYHGNKERWFLDRDRVCLKTVGRGQEFVLNCDRHSGVRDYFVDQLRLSTASPTTCTHEAAG
jgi:hypothetical protein